MLILLRILLIVEMKHMVCGLLKNGSMKQEDYCKGDIMAKVSFMAHGRRVTFNARKKRRR